MMVAPAEATDVEITNLKRTEKSNFFRNNRKNIQKCTVYFEMGYAFNL